MATKEELRIELKSLRNSIAEYQIISDDLESIIEYMRVYAQLYKMSEDEGSLETFKKLYTLGEIPEVPEREQYEFTMEPFDSFWKDSKDCKDENLESIVERGRNLLKAFELIQYQLANLYQYKRSVDVLMEMLNPTKEH